MILTSNTERAPRVLLASLLCLAMAQGSRAADTVTASVLACAKLAESARLACYDQLAARLSEQRSPEPRIDAQFGLPRPVEHAASSSITARVTRVHLTPQQGAIIELDNGQRWQEHGHADLDLAAGDTVRISRAALGSFWLSTPGNRGAKVTRLP